MLPPGENHRCASKLLLRGLPIAVLFVCGILSALAHAQTNEAVFRGQSKETQLMILLGVQQGISSLPPATGQSFSYVFDYDAEAFVREAYVGPTILRRPEVIGNRRLNLRMAVSYFELSHDFSPIFYEVQTEKVAKGTGQGENEPSARGFTAYGLEASAKVAVLNFAAAYGFWDRFEARLTLPVVIVDAHAATEFFVPTFDAETAPSEAPVAASESREQFFGEVRSEENPNGTIVRRLATFEDTNNTPDEGTDVGLGRIGLGGKASLYKSKRFQVAAATELFFPSPNQDELAGPDSFAVGPRVIGELVAADSIRLLLDLGYDYDFEHAELRRFVWNTGASIGYGSFTFDLGFGGSEYAEGVKWTPDAASAILFDSFGNPDTLVEFIKVPGEDNELSTTTVDLLVGIKLEVANNLALTGAVSVPLDDREFRPDAQGTLGVEVQFDPGLF